MLKRGFLILRETGDVKATTAPITFPAVLIADVIGHRTIRMVILGKDLVTAEYYHVYFDEFKPN